MQNGERRFLFFYFMFCFIFYFRFCFVFLILGRVLFLFFILGFVYFCFILCFFQVLFFQVNDVESNNNSMPHLGNEISIKEYFLAPWTTSIITVSMIRLARKGPIRFALRTR